MFRVRSDHILIAAFFFLQPDLKASDAGNGDVSRWQEFGQIFDDSWSVTITRGAWTSISATSRPYSFYRFCEQVELHYGYEKSWPNDVLRSMKVNRLYALRYPGVNCGEIEESRFFAIAGPSSAFAALDLTERVMSEVHAQLLDDAHTLGRLNCPATQVWRPSEFVVRSIESRIMRESIGESFEVFVLVCESDSLLKVSTNRPFNGELVFDVFYKTAIDVSGSD